MDNLLKCPFCGGKVRIIVCDEEGNRHNDEYEQDPWSGLHYKLMHTDNDVPKNKCCPISTREDETLGSGSYYNTREEAIQAWKSRRELDEKF